MGCVVGQELRSPFLIFMGLPQYAAIFPHKFREEYPNKSCVYKIWVGDGFFIWKAQSLHNSMYHIGGDMERRIRLGPKPGHLFSKMEEYIISSLATEVEVEVLLQSDDPFELLKLEYTLLQESKENPTCLNVSFLPCTPKWISEEIINEYNKWKQ